MTFRKKNNGFQNKTGTVALGAIMILAISGCNGGSSSDATADNDNGIKKELVSITLTGPDEAVPVGLSIQTELTGYYNDETSEVIDVESSNYNVVFTSDDQDIATVNDKGQITARGTGDTSVYASIAEVNSNSIDVNVSPAILLSLDIEQKSITIPNGLSQQLALQGTYSDKSVYDLTRDAGTTWLAEDSSVAVVNSTGSVTARSTDEQTTVAASHSEVQSNSITVNTISPVISELVIPSLINIPVNMSVQLTSQGRFTDGSLRSLESVSWTIADSSVAVIDSDSVATGRAVGSTTATASYGGIDSNVASVEVIQGIIRDGSKSWKPTNVMYTSYPSTACDNMAELTDSHSWRIPTAREYDELYQSKGNMGDHGWPVDYSYISSTNTKEGKQSYNLSSGSFGSNQAPTPTKMYVACVADDR